jgi:hypothetical protein
LGDRFLLWLARIAPLCEANMTDRKKPGAAFWASVVAVVVALYVLSYGPALSIYARISGPVLLHDAFWGFYGPLRWTALNAGAPFGHALVWYIRLWP